MYERPGSNEYHEYYGTYIGRVPEGDALVTLEREWQSARALLGRLEILVPLEGLIDVGAECARIGKELGRLGKELERSEGKLANERFVSRAPPEVVAKEQQRVAEFRDAITRLEAQRQTLGC